MENQLKQKNPMLFNPYNRAIPGHFYAVGVGPGSPDLVTLRAKRLIETAHVVLAPRSEISDESLALETVAEFLKPESQEILEHIYPMKRDPEATAKCWGEAAEIVKKAISEGKSVVQITIGDPLVYSTSSYLTEELIKKDVPPEYIHFVPGISAFQAGASLLKETLTLQEDRLTILPATDLQAVEEALESSETVVLYKAAKHLKKLADLLERKKLLDSAFLVCYAEQGEKERIFRDIKKAADENSGYMSTMFIRVSNKKWMTEKI